MAHEGRVPRAELTGVLGTVTARLSARRFGQVPDALGVMWHSRRVLVDMYRFSRAARRWRACDPQLLSLAHMAAVGTVGCSFCLDLGYFQARHEGLDVEKARQVPRWRESELFTALERDVLAYAEAMSSTPPTVTDAMSADLVERLGPQALVELTAFVAAANMASRTNVALGVEAQGLAASCGLPPLAVRSAA